MPFDHGLFGSDLLHLNWPTRKLLADGLRSGAIPWWVPEAWCGVSLHAEAPHGFAYPLNLLLFSLLPAHTAFAWSLLTAYLIGGWGMLWWARGLGLSAGAAGLAGLAFMGGGFMIGHVMHAQMVQTAAWIPVALGAVERFASAPRGRWAAFGALAIGMGALTCHPEVWYYGFSMVVLYGTLRLFPRRPGLQTWLVFGGLLASGAGLAAVQWLPTLELARLSEHSGGMTWEEAGRWTVRWSDLWLFIDPFRFGTPAQVAETIWPNRGFSVEKCGYIGLIPLGLAAVGMAGGRRRGWPTWTLGALAALGVFLGMTQWSVVHWLWETVPGMKFGRHLSRWVLMTALSLPVLAGMGFDLVTAGPARRVLIPVIIGLTGLDLWLFGQHHLLHVPPSWYTRPPAVVSVLPPGERVYSVGWMAGYLEAVRLARRGTREYQDLLPFEAQREQLPLALPLAFGRSTATGYPAFLVQAHRRWSDAVSERTPLVVQTGRISARGEGTFLPVDVSTLRYEPEALRLLRVAGVRYHLSYWTIRNAELRMVERIPARAGMPSLQLYEDPGRLPRVRMVSSAVWGRSPEEAVSWLLRSESDPVRTVFIEGRAPLFSAPVQARLVGSSTANLERASRTQLDVSVRTPGAGWLVVSDTWYPGWEALLDGHPTPLLRAYGVFRAVLVPPGHHHIRMLYYPRMVWWGLGITCLSALLIGLLGWRLERKHAR